MPGCLTDIDCDRDPHIPPGYRIVSHKRIGKLPIESRGDVILLDGKRMDLYQSLRQVEALPVRGNSLISEFSRQQLVNACVLDHLSFSPDDIPSSWGPKLQEEPRQIFFAGTIFNGLGESTTCVRGFWLKPDGIARFNKQRTLNTTWDKRHWIVVLKQ